MSQQNPKKDIEIIQPARLDIVAPVENRMQTSGRKRSVIAGCLFFLPHLNHEKISRKRD